MCLALAAFPNSHIPKSALKNGFSNNSDGAGFAYAKDGQIVLDKGFFSFKAFYKAWKSVPTDAARLVHFRQASHGKTNIYNCHPWVINDDFVLIHNGMIWGFGDANVSDTGDFVEQVLKPLFASLKNPQEDFNTPWFKYIINSVIGKYNKFCILSRWGEIAIYNQLHGFIINGVWHSNAGGLVSSRALSESETTEDNTLHQNFAGDDTEDVSSVIPPTIDSSTETSNEPPLMLGPGWDEEKAEEEILEEVREPKIHEVSIEAGNLEII